jgi:hypothetical protein
MSDMPKDRSGVVQMPLRRSTAPSTSEPLFVQNAPRFRTPQEFQKWLNGTVTRRELSDDFKRLSNGLGQMFSMLSVTDAKLQILVEHFARRGELNIEEYEKAVEVQLQFKHVLDTVNFAMKDIPMQDRIGLVLHWNEEHPDKYVRGEDVRGLAEWLKDTKSADIVTRFEIAQSVHFDVDLFFTEEEKKAVAEAVAAAAAAAAQAPSPVSPGVPSEEVFGTPTIQMSPPREQTEEEKTS